MIGKILPDQQQNSPTFQISGNSAWAAGWICTKPDLDSVDINQKAKWFEWNLFSSQLIIGPILWGHSGPLCHALSLSLSSSLSWTSMRACDSGDTWWMGVRRLTVANGPNIFQMLLVWTSSHTYIQTIESTHPYITVYRPFSRWVLGSTTVDPITVSPDSSAARATATAKSASARNAASASLLSLEAFSLLTSSLSISAELTSAPSSCELSMASAHEASTESVTHTQLYSVYWIYHSGSTPRWLSWRFVYYMV